MQERERIELIDEYAGGHTSRAAPLFFAGRADELDTLAVCLNRVRKSQPGAVTVIHGIPGAGKTALAERFCREAASQGVAVIRRGALSLLTDADAFARAVALAQTGELPERIEMSETLGGGIGANLAVAKAAVTFGQTSKRSAPRESVLPLALEAYRVDPARPAILFLDEAQRMTPACHDILVELHAGDCGVPILPLLAGLSPLREKLRDAGLSRLEPGADIDLGPISVAAARESIRRTCEEFGVWTDQAGRIAAALAPATHGFPAHINAAIRGVADVLRRHGYAMPRAAEKQCAAAAARLRKEYYDARLDSAADVPDEFWRVLANASKHAEHDGTVHVRDIADDCRDVLAEHCDAALTVSGCLRLADQRGVLAYSPRKRTLRFAAPNMVAHILGEQEPELRGDTATARDEAVPAQ